MEKKDKIKQLLGRLSKLEGALPEGETKSLVEQIIGDKYKDVTAKVKSDSSLVYLDKINAKLDKFKRDFDLAPVVKTMSSLQEEVVIAKGVFEKEAQRLSKDLEDKRTELANAIKTTRDTLHGSTSREIASTLARIAALEDELSYQTSTSSKKGESISQSLKGVVADMEKELVRIGAILNDHAEVRSKHMVSTDARMEKMGKDTQGALESIEKLRRDLMSRLANVGGGNANRNILVNSNPSVLGRYTDLNIKPGSNITLSYTNNDTLKTTDLTITGTGAGGLTRSIATTSVSSVVGAVASTDYVVIASAGVKITLPTAVGNSNLYTIKNTAASSVLVAADGAETIDGTNTILLSTQYTAVDLNSDSANWHIT